MKKIIALFGVWLLPVFAFAQGVCTNTSSGVCGVLYTIRQLLNTVVPILITIGLIYFIWGVVEYVIGKTEEAKKEGRDKMIYGIIGLFVIVSVWGLVGILGNTFGLQPGGNPSALPTVI